MAALLAFLVAIVCAVHASPVPFSLNMTGVIKARVMDNQHYLLQLQVEFFLLNFIHFLYFLFLHLRNVAESTPFMASGQNGQRIALAPRLI